MERWKLWRGENLGKPTIICEGVLKYILKEENMSVGRGWKA
jgi:hypothetical protein